MSATLALVALAGATGQPYPVTEVLNTARSACAVSAKLINAGDFDGTDGWAAEQPKPKSWLERSLRLEREIFGDKMPPSKVFARVVAGRKLYVFLNRIPLKEGGLRTCSVQDPSAVIEAAPDQIVSWAGRPPFDPGLNLGAKLQRGFDNIVFKKHWKPGLEDDASSSTIIYLPAEYSSEEGNSGLTYSSEHLVQTDTK